jgi:holo-[acyl-carrier protein] synthase
LSPELAGVGVALLSVPRFDRAVERFGDRLLARLFLPGEVAYARRRRTGVESLAVRLAAKWAGRDALAQAGLTGIPLRELEVVRQRGGAPRLEPRGATAGRCGPEALFTLSLTHDRELAMATVWLERARSHASLSRR